MSLPTAGFRKWFWLSFYHFLLSFKQGSHSAAGHGTEQNWTLTPLLSDCASKSSVRDNLWYPQTSSLWAESVPAWDLYLVRMTQRVPTTQQSQHTDPGIFSHLNLFWHGESHMAVWPNSWHWASESLCNFPIFIIFHHAASSTFHLGPIPICLCHQIGLKLKSRVCMS